MKINLFSLHITSIYFFSFGFLFPFDCKDFIDNILKTNFKSGNLKNNFNDFLATRACKSAVKGGDKLSNQEIEYLIQEIIENNTPMFCPHGRPIAIKFDKKDVEKWFKRII